jgi:PAS domain S-box-containing protein
VAQRNTQARPEPRAPAGPAAPPSQAASAGAAAPAPSLALGALERTLPLYIADRGGAIEYANQLYRDMAAALGWPADSAVVPAAEVLDAAANGRTPFKREHGAGTWTKCHGQHDVIRDESGTPTHLVATFEHAPMRPSGDHVVTRRRLSDIVRLATDWIWETDRALRFTYVSPRVTDLLGYHPKELADHPWSGITVDDAPLTVDPDAGWIPSLAARDVRLRHRDGSERLAQISAVPIYDGETFTGYRGVARDVTALRSREDALQQAKEQAEQADRAKSLFLAQMSHELRTPLNAIIGFSEIISAESLGSVGVPAYREYAGDILASARHLLTVINDVLDVSKIESGTFELAEDETDANNLMTEARRLVLGHFGEDRVTIRLAPVDASVRLEVDVARLRQVLVNLLSNAAKYSPEGGTVDVVAELDAAGRFAYRVADGGPGMSDDQIAVALQPFGQVDASKARQHGGIGLGLPLAERLMAQHGGELRVHSTPSAGTEVDAILPAERVAVLDGSTG